MPASDITLTASFADIVTTNTVTVAGGSVVGGVTDVLPGVSVSISANIPAGQEFSSWTASDGTLVTVTDTATGDANFVMPASDITLSAIFTTVGGNGTPFQIDLSSATVAVSNYHGSLTAPSANIPEGAGVFNGDGLNGDLHNRNFNDGWGSITGAASNKWITVDLGSTYNLDHLTVWNGNAFGLTHRGIKQGDIYIAGAGLNDMNVENSGAEFIATGWNELVADQTFTRAIPSVNVGPSDANISLQNTDARYLAIKVDSLWSGNRLSLAEIQVFGTNAGAPTTNAVLVAGGSVVGGVTDVLPGVSVAITANIPAGQEFTSWTASDGTFVTVTDTATGDANFVMPASDITLTASFADVVTTNTVTVAGGSVVGGVTDVLPGVSVSISANIPAGQEFTSWTASDGTLVTVTDTATGDANFVMPASDITLTASFADIVTTNTVTVAGGSVVGGVTEVLPGVSVSISANIPAGQEFSSWTASDGTLVTVTDTATGDANFVMPASDITLTASFATVGGGGSVLIPPSQLSAASSTNYVTTTVLDAFNGEGLSGDFHDDNLANGWLSAVGNPADQWLTVDLGGTYTLDHLRVWNFNQNHATVDFSVRGIQQADLYYTNAVSPDNNFSGQGTVWQPLVLDQLFTRAPDLDSYANTDANISLPQVSARHIAIDIDSGYAGNIVGLAEMQIYAVDPGVVTSGLTVNGGTGSGVFEVGSQQSIVAPQFFNNEVFLDWTGDTEGIDSLNLNSFDTTFIMQSGDSEITANYVPISTYTLTVNGGTIDDGSGSSVSVLDVIAGGTVTITAPATLAGDPFSGWTSSAGGIFGSIVSEMTTFTMPAAVTNLTANYSSVGVGSGNEVIPFSELTVTASSTGGGSVANAFNSAGMINDFHDSNWPNSWISGNNNDQAAGEWIKVDLNGVYDLTSLEIWNGNQPGVTFRGIKQGDIYVATSDPGSTVPASENVAGSGWDLLIENQQFAISPTTSLDAYFDSTGMISLIDPLGLNRNEGVSYFAIHVDSTFAPASHSIKSVAISELRISHAAVTRSLTVGSGAGDGLFAEGETAGIVAGPAPVSGEVFYAWSGDVSYVADIYSASTTFTMPASAANVTATYGIPGPFNLNVANGTGSSNTTGTLVNIQAATAPAGKEFYAWVGADASLLADPSSSSTSIVMPPNDVNVTAEYITVNTGAANLALNKTIEPQGSSQNEDPSHPFAHAIDGNKDTYWRPTDGADSSIVVDLGQVYSHIDRVNLQYTLVGAPDYYIEYKEDLAEANWTEATQVTRTGGFTALNVDSRFAPISARYIRYRVGSTGTPVNLSDFQVFQQRSLQELIERDGTPNFIQKVNSNQPVTIGYLGGSVTDQAGGWREQSQRMFQEMFSSTSSSVLDVTQKQQTKGGHPSADATGEGPTATTNTGLTRIENIVTFDPNSNFDVLKIAVPDLVFLEFAINDETQQGYEATIKHAEIMVRRIWEVKADADIVFVYTIRQSFDRDDNLHGYDLINGELVPNRNLHTQPSGPLTSSGAPLDDSGLLDDVVTLNEGYYQTSAAAFEEIADYYGIPTIHMGKDTAARIPAEIRMDGSADGLTSEDGFDVFSSDGIHPYASTGHVWYTEALTRSFNQIKLVSGDLIRDITTMDPIRGGSSALAASTSGGDDSFLSGLALESQQLSVTDEALFLLEETSGEEVGTNDDLLSAPTDSNALDSAFQQLGLQGQEDAEDEGADFDDLLVSSGLSI